MVKRIIESNLKSSKAVVWKNFNYFLKDGEILERKKGN